MPRVEIRSVDDARRASDIAYEVDLLRDLLDYGEDDRKRILASATLLLPHTAEILDTVYGQLLRFSHLRRFFEGSDGGIDDSFLEKRRKTLFEWLAHTAAGSLDARLAGYLDEIALRHRLRDPQAGILLSDVLMAFGLIEHEFHRHLSAAVSDPSELKAVAGSWIKMFAAQRALFARAYERPSAVRP